MNAHPQRPIPQGELTPTELRDEIGRWAVGHGYTYETTPARSEAWKVVVRDPNDGTTYTTIPKAHHGRRLRHDQVRYTVRNLNSNWRN
jgi:hypothetical protein